MKKIQFVITTVLIIVFSSNMVFADNTTMNAETKAEGYVELLKDTQRSINFAGSAVKSTVLDEGERLRTIETAEQWLKRHPAPNPKKRPKRDPKPASVSPKKKFQKVFVQTRRNRKPRRGNKTTAKKNRANRAKSIARNLDNFFIGIPLENLTDNQRNSLRRKLEKMLTKKVVIALLNSIQWAEGGAPTLPVGGLKGNGFGPKSDFCKQKIRELDLSGHPKDQGLRKECFFFNKNVKLWSLAAGDLQITYTNWLKLKELFKFKNFSEKNQFIAGLELMRTSATRGYRVGSGLVALQNDDVFTAARAGVAPWAGVERSPLKGHKKSNFLVHVQQELKKLQNEKYAKQQEKRLSSDNNS